MHHYILQTVPNQEVRARRECEALGLKTTMPLEKVVRRSRGRGRPTVAYMRPLLPGYLVISGTEIPFDKILHGVKERRRLETEAGAMYQFATDGHDQAWLRGAIERANKEAERLSCLKFCRGLLGFGGRPSKISDDLVDYIANMSVLDPDARPSFNPEVIAPGDQVTIIDSEWGKSPVRVKDINEHRAQIIFVAFGAEHTTTIDPTRLQKVA